MWNAGRWKDDIKEIVEVPFSDILQIGNYSFDRWKCVLSCDNKEILCTV